MNFRVFLIIVFIVNLIQGICTPIIDDEAYYWLWSTKLNAGYFDHPPMISFWIAISDFFLNGEIGARLFTIIFNTIAVYFLWKILNPETKQQQSIFYVTYLSLIFVQIFSFISTPDAPLLFFTILYLFALKNFIKKPNFNWSILLGFTFAGLMYSKYHGILVILSTLLPILSFVLKRPTFYFAVVFSLFLYLPHFYWLYQNDFPPISYHFIDRSAEQKFSILQPLNYILTAIFSAAGLLFVFILQALKKVNQSDLFKRSVFWLVIGPFFFFLLSTFKDTTQAQWLLISYIGVGLILYWYGNDVENKWFFRLGCTTAGLVLMARIVIMIPSISPFYETKSFGIEAGKNTSTQIAAFEKYQEASIFQFYNRDKIGVVYRTLGNRNSQFSLWDTEQLLADTFTYVSPWIQSDSSFIGLKNKTYYTKIIEGYKPIHLSEIVLNFKNDQDFKLKNNEHLKLNFQINKFDIDLLKNKKVSLNLYITQDQQYNIVKDVNIPLTSWVNKQEVKDGFVFDFNWKVDLQPGEYVAYIGIYPEGLIAKYQSKPIKLIVTN